MRCEEVPVLDDINLLPCPFCGSTRLGKTVRAIAYSDNDYTLSFYCLACGGHGGKSRHLTMAIEKWNKRT